MGIKKIKNKILCGDLGQEEENRQSKNPNNMNKWKEMKEIPILLLSANNSKTKYPKKVTKWMNTILKTMCTESNRRRIRKRKI